MEPFEKQGSGADFMRFCFSRLLPRNPSLPRGPGRDDRQRMGAADGDCPLRAPRGLAVAGDTVRLVPAQALDPGGERLWEQRPVGRVPDIAPRVMQRNARRERPKAAGKRQLLSPPLPDFRKPSAPASVAHRTKSMISGKGYTTLPRWRGSSYQRSLDLPLGDSRGATSLIHWPSNEGGLDGGYRDHAR